MSKRTAPARMPRTREGTLALDDGDVVAYRSYGTLGRPKMLLYNGLLANDLHWRAFVAHHAPRFDVITFDYRGHGESGPPRDLASISIDSFAKDGHLVLAATGGGPAILCGLSMGVQAVLAHVRHAPADASALLLLCGNYGHPLDRIGGGERTRKIVGNIVSSIAAAGPASKALLWPFLATPIGREIAFATGGADRKLLPAGFFDELFAHVLRLEPGVVAAAVRSWVAHTAEEVLTSVTVPTLIFAGGADQLAPPERARFMQQRIPGAELVIVENESHLLQVERPALVHERVGDWLTRHGLA